VVVIVVVAAAEGKQCTQSKGQFAVLLHIFCFLVIGGKVCFYDGSEIGAPSGTFIG
jgi:hypothetical protein